MKIVLLGGNGQVGWELRRALAPLGEVIALMRDEGGDLGHLADLTAALRRTVPDAIVNAAAYTAVDAAEANPETARTVNAEAPAVLAYEAKKLGAWLVHYSTDYVFDGSGDQPWREDDATGPLSVYGRTKLEGETAIRESGCAHLVFRTSWVYAARGRNFIRTMLRLAAEKETLQVIDDQHGAPTGAELIADVTAQTLPATMSDPERAGLYHLAAAGQTTWHGYAREVIAQARAKGLPVKVADCAIKAVATEAFPTPARRPRNSRLDCRRLERAFGLRMPMWQLGVQRALAEILACKSTA